MGAIFVTIAVLILLSALLNTGMTAISGASQGELRLSHPRTASYISPQSAITRRNGTFNILALRVEFKRDTLSTTTGDGSFDYDAKDSVYYDPPPHDSQYFSDMLEFNRFYWQEMSNGAIDFTWDIYPLDSQAAYQLPKKMWQYNYNYPTDRNSSHLDSTLSLLFRDAVAVADSDTAIVWADYDLVVIFHAGSGAEFDLGFTVTPHDIPSAWMVKKDFELIEMDEGIPVSDNGVTGFVTEGLILPETESHDDVQISMAGVVVFLFGHWLGLPALYDRDNGDAVVGKWSLLDRGFGNFYGVLPGPVDAWSKTYMGWLNPVELTPGNWSISARGFELPGLSDTIQAAKVYITQDEYFLLECRYRSTVGEFKDDSVAVLYDSNDSMMFLKEDYSVDTERTADNFRVPVRADNLDFDTPGSGILIWHVDESLLPLVQDGRFNSVDAHRGLDLEEADGAQDIGRDYPFLTAGYGTDYGIFEDAWFRNNEAHRNANKRDAITFGEGTFPNSRANSGAFSGIAIGNFSFTDIVMSFTFTNSGWLYDLPIQHDLDAKLVAVGNFDNTPDDQEFVIFGSDSLNIFDGDGDILARVPYGKEYYIYQHNDPIVRNLDNDDYSEVVWTVLDEAASNSNAVILCLDPDPVNGFQIEIIDTFVPSHSSMRSDTKIAFGGAEDQTVIQVLQPIRQANEIISLLRSYDSDFAPLAETELSGIPLSMHRLGTMNSDTFLVITNDYRIYLWDQQNLKDLGEMFDDLPEIRSVNAGPHLADFDRNGKQDVIVMYDDKSSGNQGLTVVKTAMAVAYDIGYTDNVIAEEYLLDKLTKDIRNALPFDVDKDGAYELIGFLGYDVFNGADGMLAIESNTKIVEGFPRNLSSSEGVIIQPWTDFKIADLDGDLKPEYLYLSSSKDISVNDNSVRPWLNYRDNLIEIKNSNGENLNGFPVASRLWSPECRLCQLDDDPGLELLMVTGQEFDVYDFEFSVNGTPSIWWGQDYRDNDHSNAIWEPATPFTPTSAIVLMPEDLCYNWPNPATEETRIRYFLNFDADVNINIFDIMGEKVKSFNRSEQTAGLNHEIVWQLEDIARGIYMAVVKADGSGKTDTKVVKIAVVK